MVDINGTANDDTLNGGTDADLIDGSGGNDTIDGGSGNDTITGGNDNDTITGGLGDDSISGNMGDDTIFGGNDNDTIDGDGALPAFDYADYPTVLRGPLAVRGITNDSDIPIELVIINSTGNDVVVAGGVLQPGDTSTHVLGPGDMLFWRDPETGDVYETHFDGNTSFPLVFTGGGNDSIDGGDGLDTIFGGAGDDTIDGGNQADIIDGGSGADSILGGQAEDTITGGLGDDTIDGGTYNDIIDGGDGADLIAGGDGADSIDGGDGADSILAGSQNDYVFGGIGDDTIDGGTYNDELIGGTGSDSLIGGDSSDIIYGDLPEGYTNVLGFEYQVGFGDGDGGWSGFTPSDVPIIGQPQTITFIDDDAILDNDDASENFSGTDPNQMVLVDGVARPAFIEGQITFLGSNGVTYTFAVVEVDLDGDNTSNSGTVEEAHYLIQTDGGTPPPIGTNLVYVSRDGSSDLNYADLPIAGEDTVFNDTIDGGNGFDTIYGQEGDDIITGGGGSDTIFGGSGADNIDGGDSADLIDGGDDADTIVGGRGNDSIDGGTGDDIITGDVGSDTIFGGSGADSIDGGDSADLIDGGDDADTIFGGLGNDSIDGGTGDDTIDGGSGDDTIYGDGTASQFTFGAAPFSYASGSNLGDGAEAGQQHVSDVSSTQVSDLIITTYDGNNTLTSGEVISFSFVNENGDLVEVENATVQQSAFGNGSPGTGALSAQGIDQDGDPIAILVHLSGTSVPAGTTFFDTDTDPNITNETDVVLDPANVTGSYNDVITGGAGDDTIFGDKGDDQITVGVGDTASGGDDRDNFTLNFGQTSSSGSTTITVDGNTEGDDLDTLDLSGLGAFTVTQTTDADGDSTSGTVTYASGQTVNFTEIENLIVCFAAGTLIEADHGIVAVEDLSVGDMVQTADNGLQPIRWVGRNKLTVAVLEQQPKLRPIRIRAGALGDGMPETDLLVSPQHRVLIRSKIVEKMFTDAEVLVAAKQLVMLDGIDIAHDVKEVTYFHFLCDQHEVVYSNGAATESLYTGPEALNSVSPESREEILTLFPELNHIDYKALSARKLANGRKGRKIAIRHKKNNKPLFQPTLH